LDEQQIAAERKEQHLTFARHGELDMSPLTYAARRIKEGGKGGARKAGLPGLKRGG
jgi:hypothetical protein